MARQSPYFEVKQQEKSRLGMNLEDVTRAWRESGMPQTEAGTESICLVDLLMMEALGLGPKL